MCSATAIFKNMYDVCDCIRILSNFSFNVCLQSKCSAYSDFNGTCKLTAAHPPDRKKGVGCVSADSREKIGGAQTQIQRNENEL